MVKLVVALQVTCCVTAFFHADSVLRYRTVTVASVAFSVVGSSSGFEVCEKFRQRSVNTFIYGL